MALVDRIFAFGRIVASKLSGKANAVLVNLTMFDDAGAALEEDEAIEEAPDEPLFGTMGVYCRPDPPNVEGYAEVLALRIADGARPVACRDLRLSKRVNPKEGELGLSHYGGGFVSLKWNDDKKGTTLTMMAPVLKAGLGDVDKSHALIFDTATGNNSIGLIHMDGMALMMTKEGNVILKSNSGANRIVINDDGMSTTGKLTLLGGVVVGDPSNVPLPVALYPAWAVWATEVQAALTAIAAAAGLPINPVIVPPVAFPTPITASSQTLKASPI